MTVWLAGREITGLCTRVILEKDRAAAGMEATLRAVCAPEDGRLPKLNPSCGETLEVREGETQLFFGTVETIRYDAAALTLILQCFDPAARLARCQCYGPLEGTPAEIAAALCRECGLEPGTLAEGSGQITRLGALCGRSAYRGIRQVYGEGYTVEYREGKISVVAVGESRAVLDGGRLLALTAKNTAEDAVNRVRVCGGGQILAEVSDPAGLAQQGLRQKTESPSSAYAVPREQAEAGLRGMKREASAVLEGLYAVRCGQRVTLDRPMAGAYGDYAVTAVRLCCGGGRKTTELEMEGI